MKFPAGKVFTISFMSFAMSFGTMMLFSFLPFMVNSFFPDFTRDQLGWLTAYITSSYYLGAFFGGLIWGKLSDSWGRRPTIYFATVGSLVFMVLFGFSQNFLWALITRFLWGSANGAVGVYKTYISEVLDNQQQSQGFSIFGVATGLGTVLGPVIGGFLSQPAEKYSLFHHSFFCRWPFILPIMVVATLNIISLIGFTIFVTESLSKEPSCSKEYRRISFCDVDSDNDADSNSSTPSQMLTTPNGGHTVAEDIYNYTDMKDSSKKGNCYSSLLKLLKKFLSVQMNECILCFVCARNTQDATHTDDDDDDHPNNCVWSILKSFNLIIKVLIDRRVALSLYLFLAVGGLDMVVLELSILLLVSDEKHGGFNMTENEIGILFLIAGISETIFLFVFYPLFIKLIGYRGLLTVSIITFAMFSIFVPWSSFILIKVFHIEEATHSNISESLNLQAYCLNNSTIETFDTTSTRMSALIWIAIAGVISTVSVARIFSRLTAIVLVNNSTVSETKGTVNGVSQSLVSLARATDHFVIVRAFAWSQNNSYGTWPLNYHFTFMVCAVILLSILPVITCLPPSIEKKRTKL